MPNFFSAFFLSQFHPAFGFCRIEKLLPRRSSARNKRDPKKNDEIVTEGEQNDFYVERIRIENMHIRCFEVWNSFEFCLFFAG